MAAKKNTKPAATEQPNVAEEAAAAKAAEEAKTAEDAAAAKAAEEAAAAKAAEEAKATEEAAAAKAAEDAKAAEEAAAAEAAKKNLANANKKPDGGAVALRIFSKQVRFRRAGITFGREAQVIPLEDLSEEQIAALKDEPRLVVTEIFEA